MYIKKVIKRNKRSQKPYEYLHLVENVRTEKGPRQRLVLNLGVVNIAKEQYKDLANCIEGVLTGQKSLFSANPEIEKHAKKAVRRMLEKRSKEEALQKALDPNLNENAAKPLTWLPLKPMSPVASALNMYVTAFSKNSNSMMCCLPAAYQLKALP
jgi:hypothetical protein